jgi:polygalacturonase
VGDDAICIKSGKDEEGRKRGKPTENVVVRYNVVYNGHGGFVIGSEMSGGARNIFVYNCSFIGTDNGLRFKTVRGRGGIVENIYVRNIAMKNIVANAILFDMYYFVPPPENNKSVEVPPVSEATPQFRNFYISNIVCNEAERGIFIRGLPEMNVSNIYLNKLVLKTTKGVDIIEGSGIHLDNVSLVSEQTNPLIYLENSKEIELNNIKYVPGAGLLLSVNWPGQRQHSSF